MYLICAREATDLGFFEDPIELCADLAVAETRIATLGAGDARWERLDGFAPAEVERYHVTTPRGEFAVSRFVVTTA